MPSSLLNMIFWLRSLDVKLEPEYFLGIDGGGTKTDFALIDKNENVIGRVKLEACNPIDVGLDVAKSVLERGIRAVCRDIPKRKIAMWAGIAGGGSQEMRAPLHEFFASFNFSRFDNNNDAVLVAYSALGDGDGISVIMGTGSILYLKIGDQLLLDTIIRSHILNFRTGLLEGGQQSNIGSDMSGGTAAGQ